MVAPSSSSFAGPLLPSARLTLSRVRAILALMAGGILGSAIACQDASSRSAPGSSGGAAAVHADFPPSTHARPRNADAFPTRNSPHQSGRASAEFHSRQQLDAHFAKHGAEFGNVTQEEYLRQAQILRDAPVGGTVEEIKRPDGTVSRYDRASGAFLAFDADGTIRTFFKPNDGEAYFRRQALRSH
jgi:pyocin large subunit-like protein